MRIQTAFKQLSCAIVTLCAVNLAHAGDLPGYNGYEPMYSSGRVSQGWAGFYAGAHAGLARGNFDTVVYSPSSKFDMASSNLSGGLFGGHNWLFNQYLLGVEVDGTYAPVSKDTVIAGSAYKGSSDFYFTARGRAGYVMDAIMVYGTLGLGATSHELVGRGSKDSAATLGWVAGIGAEVKLTNTIFARGEYLYSDYGKKNFDLGATGATSDLSLNVLRAGIGMKF